MALDQYGEDNGPAPGDPGVPRTVEKGGIRDWAAAQNPDYRPSMGVPPLHRNPPPKGYDLTQAGPAPPEADMAPNGTIQPPMGSAMGQEPPPPQGGQEPGVVIPLKKPNATTPQADISDFLGDLVVNRGYSYGDAAGIAQRLYQEGDLYVKALGRVDDFMAAYPSTLKQTFGSAARGYLDPILSVAKAGLKAAGVEDVTGGIGPVGFGPSDIEESQKGLELQKEVNPNTWGQWGAEQVGGAFALGKLAQPITAAAKTILFQLPKYAAASAAVKGISEAAAMGKTMTSGMLGPEAVEAMRLLGNRATSIGFAGAAIGVAAAKGGSPTELAVDAGLAFVGAKVGKAILGKVPALNKWFGSNGYNEAIHWVSNKTGLAPKDIVTKIQTFDQMLTVLKGTNAPQEVLDTFLHAPTNSVRFEADIGSHTGYWAALNRQTPEDMEKLIGSFSKDSKEVARDTYYRATKVMFDQENTTAQQVGGTVANSAAAAATKPLNMVSRIVHGTPIETAGAHMYVSPHSQIGSGLASTSKSFVEPLEIMYDADTGSAAEAAIKYLALDTQGGSRFGRAALYALNKYATKGTTRYDDLSKEFAFRMAKRSGYESILAMGAAKDQDVAFDLLHYKPETDLAGKINQIEDEIQANWMDSFSYAPLIPVVLGGAALLGATLAPGEADAIDFKGLLQAVGERAAQSAGSGFEHHVMNLIDHFRETETEAGSKGARMAVERLIGLQPFKNVDYNDSRAVLGALQKIHETVQMRPDKLSAEFGGTSKFMDTLGHTDDLKDAQSLAIKITHPDVINDSTGLPATLGNMTGVIYNTADGRRELANVVLDSYGPGVVGPRTVGHILKDVKSRYNLDTIDDYDRMSGTAGRYGARRSTWNLSRLSAVPIAIGVGSLYDGYGNKAEASLVPPEIIQKIATEAANKLETTAGSSLRSFLDAVIEKHPAAGKLLATIADKFSQHTEDITKEDLLNSYTVIRKDLAERSLSVGDQLDYPSSFPSTMPSADELRQRVLKEGQQGVKVIPSQLINSLEKEGQPEAARILTAINSTMGVRNAAQRGVTTRLDYALQHYETVLGDIAANRNITESPVLAQGGEQFVHLNHPLAKGIATIVKGQPFNGPVATPSQVPGHLSYSIMHPMAAREVAKIGGYIDPVDKLWALDVMGAKRAGIGLTALTSLVEHATSIGAIRGVKGKLTKLGLIALATSAATAMDWAYPKDSKASFLGDLFGKGIKGAIDEGVGAMASANGPEEMLAIQQILRKAAGAAVEKVEDAGENIANNGLVNPQAAFDPEIARIFSFSSDPKVKGGGAVRLPIDGVQDVGTDIFVTHMVDGESKLISGKNSAMAQSLRLVDEIMDESKMKIGDFDEFDNAITGLQRDVDGKLNQTVKGIRPHIDKAARRFREELYDNFFRANTGIHAEAPAILRHFGLEENPDTWKLMKFLQGQDPSQGINLKWNGRAVTQAEWLAADRTRDMVNPLPWQTLNTKFIEGYMTRMPIQGERLKLMDEVQKLTEMYPNGIPVEKQPFLDRIKARLVDLDNADQTIAARRTLPTGFLPKQQYYGPISEAEHLDMPEISREKNPSVLMKKYVKGMYSKLFFDEQLYYARGLATMYETQGGVNGPQVANWIRELMNTVRGVRSMNADSKIAGLWDYYVKHTGLAKVFGVSQTPTNVASVRRYGRAAMEFQYITKLALNLKFPVVNFSQTILTTAPVTGYGHIITALGKLITNPKEAYQEAVNAGVVKGENLYSHDIADYGGSKIGGVVGKGLNFLPSKSEAFNRILAYHAGKQQALAMLAKGKFKVPGYVKYFDHSVVESGDTMKIAEAYARAVTNTTQFVYGSLGRGQLFSGGAIGRNVGQFKTFTTAYLTLLNDTWKHARQEKDPRPLMRMAWGILMLGGIGALAPTKQMGVSAVEYLRGEAVKLGFDPNIVPKGSLVGHAASMAGMDVDGFDFTGSAVPTNNIPNPYDQPWNFGTFLAGPSFGNVMDIGKNISQYGSGEISGSTAAANSMRSLVPMAASGMEALQEAGIGKEWFDYFNYRGGVYSDTGEPLVEGRSAGQIMLRGLGLQKSVRSQRGQYLKEIQYAMEREDLERADELIEEAKSKGFVINRKDVGRLKGRITRQKKILGEENK